jgi:hypothetical protein
MSQAAGTTEANGTPTPDANHHDNNGNNNDNSNDASQKEPRLSLSRHRPVPVASFSTTLDPNSPSSPVEQQTDQDSYNFNAEFASHRQAIKEGSTDKAIQSFIMLQTNSAQHKTFQTYLIELADHIDPTTDSDMSRFFGSLPALIQSSIVESAAAYLEEIDSLRAFQVLFDYIQGYPRHAYKYLVGFPFFLCHPF